MNNSEKAKKLYESTGTNPSMNTLVPTNAFREVRGGIFQAMFLAHMINHYAEKEFEGDWIPFTLNSFYISKDDEEGWETLQQNLVDLEAKKIVESTTNDSHKYVRIITDDYYDTEIYRR